MDINNLKTARECELVIKTLQSMEAPVPKELIDKYNLLKTKTSVYDVLCHKYNYSTELQTCINETVAQLNSTEANAKEPGLLLGKIQCGKTRAFIGVMGLAFDNGFDACVVLTKSDDGLVGQTKERLELEFAEFIGNNTTVGQSSIEVYKLDRALNLSEYTVDRNKNIFVVHKNTAKLGCLIDLIKSTKLIEKRILIIDDEADFVSRAFYKKDSETSVGENALLIDELVNVADCRYLQVTATPYALFLQPDHKVKVSNGSVEPFRPRFTTLVPIHKNYKGGKHYFIKSQDSSSMYSYLRHDISDECLDFLLVRNKDQRVYGNASTTPKYKDLRNALMSYFVGSAIRQIQERETNNQENYATSFFMHIHTDKEEHEFEEFVVNSILKSWKDEIINQDTNNIECLFDFAYDDFLASHDAGIAKRELDIFMPDRNVVWNVFLEIFRSGKYMVKVINSTTSKDPNLIGKDGQLKLSSPLNIFIGGFKLDRGITIDHLIGFFYGRRPQTQQADTVLQHHRMYGNRSDYDMAVTRLHTTIGLYENMKWIDEMDHQLRMNFIKDPNGKIDLVTIPTNPKAGIRPTGNSRLSISDLDTFDSFKRLTTYGFQTDCATKIVPIIAEINNILSKYPHKEKEPFLIDFDDAVSVIKLIRSTFIYNRPIDNNKGMEWNEDAMIAAIKKFLPADGKLLCYKVTNREMSRTRSNGNFIDAPEDGNTDPVIVKQYATNRPCLMLIGQKGENDKGWRGTPFYWPSLRLPVNVKPCIYCLN